MAEIPFTIETWTPDGQRIEERVATAEVFSIAKAAFDAAVRHYPRRPITLRHGARVISKSPGFPE